MNTLKYLFLLLMIIPFPIFAYTGIVINQLPPLSYAVTQNGTTELPYDNPYWNNYAAGIYVDIITGIPLFSSRDKYDSNTGWPTFSKPINKVSLLSKIDTSLDDVRIEVVSRRSKSHLGHLFDDGPIQYEGRRYCINSAALKFIPLEQMKKQGYGMYLRFVR